jgi:hypothetical protein
MYLKGTCLNYNLFVLLENNWIIHVINLAEVQLPQIFISINAPTLSNNSTKPSKIAVSPKITVNQLLEENIVSEYSVNA